MLFVKTKISHGDMDAFRDFESENPETMM